MYPSSPHTIHPPHIGSVILGESVINLGIVLPPQIPLIYAQLITYSYYYKILQVFFMFQVACVRVLIVIVCMCDSNVRRYIAS